MSQCVKLLLCAWIVCVAGPVRAEVVSLNKLDDWAFDYSPTIQLDTAIEDDSLVIGIESSGNPETNYITAKTKVDWTVESGQVVHLELKADKGMEVYFALELTTETGQKFTGLPSGHETWPFTIDSKETSASIGLDGFKSGDSESLQSGERVVAVKIIIGPGKKPVTNKVTIQQIKLITEDK